MQQMTDYEITEAMIVYGGGFVQQLGRLFRAGDHDNQARIKATWPEYWKKYEELAILKSRLPAKG